MSRAVLFRPILAAALLCWGASVAAGDPPGPADTKKAAPPEMVTCRQGGRCALLTPDHLRQNLARDRRSGQVVVLCFWSTSCAPCGKELPEMDRLARELGPKGANFYFINQGDDVADVRDFLAGQAMSLQVVLDPNGKLGTEYAVEALPTVVLISPQGKPDRPIVGYQEGDDRVLKKRLESLLALRKENPR
jgi:thiol-disulfide isomerase/thioredoxin